MTTLILAQAASAVLVSWWKMLLIFIPFVPWAWLVSSKLEKDARFYHLNAPMWNAIHLAAGVAALAAMLLIPVIWASWPVGVAILVAPLLIYWRLRDQEVPEHERFRLTGEGLSAKLEARKKARAAREAVISFTDWEDRPAVVPLKEDPAYQIHILAEDLLGPAIDARATRLEMSVGPKGCSITQTVDGIRYKRDPVAPEAGLRLIDYLKKIAGLDVEDRRRRQEGTFSLAGPNGKAALALATAGSSSGQVVRIDFDRARQLNKPFDALGLLPAQLEALRAFEDMHERHGLIILSAPPGHGLTTTAYSFVSRHDAYTSNIKTLERQVLVEVDGVDHVQWDPANPDIDFPTNLQSILRRDPDIVMISELKDAATAKIVAEPGPQGPLLYVPIVAPSTAEAIRQWVKAVGDLKQATKPLRAVTNQRLLRTLCPNCRQAYQPTPDQLRKLNLPARKVSELFRASGKVQIKNRIEDCPICRGTGYLGQTAAFEVMLVDDELRKILASGDLKAALAHARRNKMIYLQESALSKVVNGETSIEEVIRVTAPAGTGPAAEAPKAPSPTQATSSPA